MKVYVALFRLPIDEGDTVLGVFSTRRKAQAACKNVKAMHERIETSIQECILDESCYL